MSYDERSHTLITVTMGGWVELHRLSNDGTLSERPLRGFQLVLADWKHLWESPQAIAYDSRTDQIFTLRANGTKPSGHDAPWYPIIERWSVGRIGTFLDALLGGLPTRLHLIRKNPLQRLAFMNSKSMSSLALDPDNGQLMLVNVDSQGSRLQWRRLGDDGSLEQIETKSLSLADGVKEGVYNARSGWFLSPEAKRSSLVEEGIEARKIYPGGHIAAKRSHHFSSYFLAAQPLYDNASQSLISTGAGGMILRYHLPKPENVAELADEIPPAYAGSSSDLPIDDDFAALTRGWGSLDAGGLAAAFDPHKN